MAYLSFEGLNVEHKRVLIREDLNVPMQDGRILNDARIQAALPTLRMALRKKAKIMLLSHLGRPEEGRWDAAYSLAPLAPILSQALNHPVRFVKDWIDGVSFEADEILLLENTRFLPGEKQNAEGLAMRMAALCDCFVMDAFAVSHRAQASTTGVAQFAPVACAGPLLHRELTALAKAVDSPKPPVVAIVGGAKVSTKVDVLTALLDKVDTLVLGGGIANTFIGAEGYNIGKSLCESDWYPQAKALRDAAASAGKTIWLPTDVRVAKSFESTATATIRPLEAVEDDELILDIGPASERALATVIQHAQTILWNGPLGVFEFDHFAAGTKALANAVATSDAFSLAGGGDTINAIDTFGVMDKISYISTGGGAFLEFVEGKTLPGVAVLANRAEGQSHFDDVLSAFNPDTFKD